jgi:hypothetical protein
MTKRAFNNPRQSAYSKSAAIRVFKIRGNPRYGQVILETIVALLILFLLLAGTTKLFVWFGDSLAGRQDAFKSTRVISSEKRATHELNETDVQSLTYTEPALNIY